ncbi:DUF488 family protein [Marinoscillum sp. 108]|uniref:DUF488 domain-containing protein n=1 Tax=Marinoscillum sp. 108 TaxID=2653151 RepID=UPI0012F05A31|nr:DUF488 family protein [Marinoscillum sp. 108]VXD16198.1 conserved hypothetical protein [Marinoscillum sp. 108]
MYYRRKLLLGILEEFDGVLSHTKLQKVLLLVTRKQSEKSFDFVPYKYGSFSFQANQDLSTLSKKEIIIDKVKTRGSDWIINSDEAFFPTLKKEDQAAIKQTKKEVAKFNQQELVKYTYIKYPYFAIKSQIAEELLTDKEFEKVNAQKRSFDKPAFFTIGYEGISLETYLNKLIINDVKLLCDVRKNPLSMKYGFSKNQLKKACESVGIEYLHIPQLGIDSEKRTDLKTINDYNKLFDEYEKTTLVENSVHLEEIYKLTEKYKRIAITCFEKEPCMCHRSKVASALKQLPRWDIDQKNL